MPVFAGSSEGEMTVPKPLVFGTPRGVFMSTQRLLNIDAGIQDLAHTTRL